MVDLYRKMEYDSGTTWELLTLDDVLNLFTDAEINKSLPPVIT